MKSYLYIFVLLLFTSYQSAIAKVELEEVQAYGEGLSLSTAINNALLEIVQQTNGKTIVSQSVSVVEDIKISINDDENFINTEGYLELINSFSAGRVESYKVVNKELGADGTWRVEVLAKVAKYKRNDSANRLSVALMPFYMDGGKALNQGRHINSNVLESSVMQALMDNLVQTRKFTVLDRENISITELEKSLITSGNTRASDQAKLGQMVSADYILTGRITQAQYSVSKRKMRTSDRVIENGQGHAKLTFRLIDVATSQVQMSDSISISFTDKATGMHPSNERLVGYISNVVSKKVVDKVVGNIFPLSIISTEDDLVIISQGGNSVSIGEQFSVYKLGDKLFDNYTGELLGRKETLCCVVTITRVLPGFSYGAIQGDISLSNDEIKESNYILRKQKNRSKASSKQVNPTSKTSKESANQKLDDIIDEDDEDW